MNLYHATTENFNKFSPRYNRIFKEYGTFFSSFHSLVLDWMPYLFNRRSRKDKRDKGNKILNESHYSYLYVYTIYISKKLFDAIVRYNTSVFRSKQWGENCLYGFWLWGKQYFIPKHLLYKVKIIKKEKINYSDFLDIYYHHLNSR